MCLSILRFDKFVILFLVFALAACSGGGGGGGGGGAKTATGTSSSYSDDGSQKTITTTYSDGSSTQQTLSGTPAEPSYNGSQLNYTYNFSDGTKSPPQSLDTSQLSSESYSEDGKTKTVVYSVGNGKTVSFTLSGTIVSTSWDSDHITKTVTYQFSDNTTNPFVTTVQPILHKPDLTNAVYPSDWSTGGIVTKPITSAYKNIYGDGYIDLMQDGTFAKPFAQTVLTPNGATGSGAINDPNAFVTFTADAKPLNNNTPTPVTYDLRWGTPDPMGPNYAANFNQGQSSYSLPTSNKIFGGVLSLNTASCKNAAADTSNCGAKLSPPSSEVIDAWNKGWTGKGQNILIWDDIDSTGSSQHPATVETIAHRYAWGSTFYGMTYHNNTPSVLQLDGSIAPSPSKVSIHVINMSYGANLDYYFKTHPIGAWTTKGLLNARDDYQASYSNRADLLTTINYTGNGNTGAGFDFSDAVLTKAAGNDSTASLKVEAQYEPLVYWLSRNASDVTRLLIVGALTGVGTTTAKVDIATYSNIAGNDELIQSRFLMASGKVAFANGDNAYNGQSMSGSDPDGNGGNVGTSYAAPRVAAYAAIVRQKFENLNAANTADILLATARYDTLTCYPNCNKSIYGQGEASLSRALAPVGYLR